MIEHKVAACNNHCICNICFVETVNNFRSNFVSQSLVDGTFVAFSVNSRMWKWEAYTEVKKCAWHSFIFKVKLLLLALVSWEN